MRSFKPKNAAWAAAFAFASASVAVHAAGPSLPIPCSPGACGAGGANRFVTAGNATAVATKNSLTVNQTSNSAILNWSSFNVGAGGSVTFNQPNAASIALNRIFQNSPSQIFGSMTANGQVYLVNLNGFVFGPNSTVNVGGLLASSLPLALTDATFKNGILSPLQSDRPAFDATLDPLAPGVGRASVLDANGSPVLDANGKPLAVQILIQPGAQIAAADQGRLLFAGQSVTNGGALSAPDGQVILAAGSKVFLQADSDPSLRGLIVEVDQGGTAWNQMTGSISTPRGNVSMVGLAVNQEGRISATTSVAANGSIRLEAADTATFVDAGGAQGVRSSHGGALTLGPLSDMSILPELGSADTAVAAQTQLPSSVTLLGEQVIMQGGSIVAPGGQLTAIASPNPAAAAAPVSASNPQLSGVSAGLDPNARLRIDSGATIDLSGSVADLPVTANLVEAQLRSSELADDATQRNGALHGQTVYVNARLGGNLPIANLAADIAAVPQTIAQRTENGGLAVFQSNGDAVFADGATLNVSGGWSSYAGGVLQTSYLVGANGQLYPIATANPLLTYTGVVNPTFSQSFNSWGVRDVLPTPGLSAYQPAYVQGAPGGKVQFAAPNLVLQGTLIGPAVNGLYQRTPSTAVAGGRLVVGFPGGTPDTAGTAQPDLLAPAVRITNTPTPVQIADDASLPGALTLDLPAGYLTSSGFTSTQIYSNTSVLLPAATPLSLPPGSSLLVNAARLDLLSGIRDPGGALTFQNVFTAGMPGGTAVAAERAGMFVGDGVTLDVRGQWTNDVPAALTGKPSVAPTWQNGGSITLSVSTPAALLSIGNDDALRASGGAWMQAGGALAGGTGGSITVAANSASPALDVGQALAIDGFGVNGASGGSLTLAAPRIDIGPSSSQGWVLPQRVDDAVKNGGVFQIAANLFSDYGFQTFSLNASGLVAASAATSNVLTVDPGTAINAIVSTLQLNPGASLRASAGSVDGLSSVTTLPAYLRSGASISLSALFPNSPAGFGNPTNTAVDGGTSAGDIWIGKGASITTDVGGSIYITGFDSIVSDATLRAPGGAVSLHLDPPPTVGGFDVGFLPTQRIELGPDAVIDVSGTFISRPSSLNLTLGSVYAGGSVNLFADRGAVMTDPGSLISVTGAAAAMDVANPNGTYGHEVASSAGGAISVRSGEAISLLGGIDGSAGAAGTSGPAAAGSLNLALTRSESWWSSGDPVTAATFNAAPMTVELVPSATAAAPATSDSNTAVLGTTQIAQWGVDSLRIEAGDSLQLSGSQLSGLLSLDLGRQLIIDSPSIAAINGANARLTAPYVQLAYDVNPYSNVKAAAAGPGSVAIAGHEVDLLGTLAIQGASDVRLTSYGDMLLGGEPTGSGLGSLLGSLSVAGDLTLEAARIYPLTATNFTINAQESAPQALSIVTIRQTGSNPGAPLSAGGALTINADAIASAGTLYAPFGSITLNANQSLNLADGSLTSVSGAGSTIPFGQTQFSGQQWIYALPSGQQSVSAIPARQVNLHSPAVTVAAGATIDLSGGGDLAAYEWVPGSGGTLDKLTANPTVTGYTPGLYAVVPTLAGLPAPQDPQEFTGATILPGESIYLSGGGGLAAGTYPLLPARYALLPGAFLVQIEPQIQSTMPGLLQTLQDGTPVVAGFLSYAETGLHLTPGFTGVAIHPGSYGSQLAQYNETLASSFFSAAASAAGKLKPDLPANAGTLSIAVSAATGSGAATGLNLAGQVDAAAASGGRAASIEISASDLFVGNPTGAVAPADAVFLSGDVVDGWHAGSLLLGGTETRGTDPGKASIDVAANTVTVGYGTNLSANEVILVANQSIDVQSGAVITSTSGASGTAPATAPSPLSVDLTGAAGATPSLFAASDLNWVTPVRTAGAVVGAATLNVATGSAIASRGALTFDALGSVALDGALSGNGAEWSLGSSSIAFVTNGASPDTLTINEGLLAKLDSAGALRFASTGAIDLFKSLTLGGSALQSLTLAATTINNLNPGSGTTQLNAQTMTLQGSGAATGAAAAGATGAALQINANELDIGPDALSVNGFGATNVTASSAVVGQGTGGLSIGGDLTLAAPIVTAAAAAQTAINASGHLNISSAAAGTQKTSVLPGGSLDLSGAVVDVAGTVDAASGIVNIASAGDLTIERGALISTAGTTVSVQNQTIGTPGGAVALRAGGNLVLAGAATLDVSGAQQANAGQVALVAGGSASIDSALQARTAGTGTGGSFSLDAGSTGGDLAPLASALASGGFNQTIDLRVRSGDIGLGQGTSLSANTIRLTADAGLLTIGGHLSADSGARRGSIALFGGNGVAVSGTLRADGGASAGGTIEIGAGRLIADQNGILNQYNGGSISLTGASISAAGAAGDGTLLLRAPALTAANDVAIGSLASTGLTRLSQVIVEPVLPFNTADGAVFSNATAPTAADFAAVQTAVGNYMAAAGGAIATRLTAVGGIAPLVEPGVEIIAPAALTLNSADGVSPALDLSAWRFNGAPIDLTIRAAGDFTVANALTDGFSSAVLGSASQAQPALMPGPSASIRLAAGADLTSANPLAVNTGGSGTLTIGVPAGGTAAVVRTGTGSVDLAAAQDIVIGNAGSGVYTAGIPAIAPGGTASDPYPNLPSKAGTDVVVGLLVPVTNSLMSFPTGGGDVTVAAGRDILGAALAQPSVSAWQLREGGANPTILPTWGVNLAAYNWNFGTLGGGDLRIAAGRDALNVTAAAAGSLLPQYGGGPQYVRGGGLSLSAGRNIGSAQVFVADGLGEVTAGGALTAVLPSNSATDPAVGSAFYLQSGSINVNARLGIVADGVFNPTGFVQLDSRRSNALAGTFLSYSDAAALNLTTITGDISMGQAQGSAATLLGLSVSNASASASGSGVFPGTLLAAAPGGSIVFGAGIGAGGRVTLAPSPVGQLDLLAGQAISGGNLMMSDAVPGSYATVATPIGTQKVSDVTEAFNGSIHLNDALPALISAGADITDLTLSIPKAADVVAGNDIVDLRYDGQNLNPTDLTALSAGRDFVFTSTQSSVSVGGPGGLDILAGRNVSLGFSITGVITTGNLSNANLATSQGADLTIAAGLGTAPNYQGFVDKIVAPSATYQAALVDYVNSIDGGNAGSFAAARTEFAALAPALQLPLIDRVFFNELSLSGIAANTVPGAGFAEGYAAIDALYPGSRSAASGAVAGAYAGDLTLDFSRIYTLSGGDITLLAPGGRIDVGLANPPGILASRSPSTLGIVAEGAGNVDIYTKSDVNVNASRVFTLGGGNILIWSDEGSIDAGRGAKTAVSAPPPSILINSDGTVTINFSGAAAGSGIRTIQTDPSTPAGNVDLIAPEGTVNAGDAGIGAAGNINIAARSVIGVTNINFGGSATGVPATISSVGASLSGASSAASGASNAATSAVASSATEKEAASSLAQSALSWLDVFVTGLGEENCKPDDIECLKRQKTPSH